MSAVTVRVWSDYVCPWCYIGLTEMQRLRANHELAVEWFPFELRPNAPEEGWDLPPHIKAMKARPDNPLQARAKELGITLVERDRIPSSRRAHECTEYARANGKLHEFHAAVLKAYWTEGKDIHDWAVLEELARTTGVDAAAMREQVTAGTWRRAVDDKVNGAREIGVNAVPTFLFAEKFIVQGAQTLEVLEKVMARLRAG